MMFLCVLVALFRHRWMQSELPGGFAKKHRTTVFKPFKIQELMIDAVLQPGVEIAVNNGDL